LLETVSRVSLLTLFGRRGLHLDPETRDHDVITLHLHLLKCISNSGKSTAKALLAVFAYNVGF